MTWDVESEGGPGLPACDANAPLKLLNVFREFLRSRGPMMIHLSMRQPDKCGGLGDDIVLVCIRIIEVGFAVAVRPCYAQASPHESEFGMAVESPPVSDVDEFLAEVLISLER